MLCDVTACLNKLIQPRSQGPFSSFKRKGSGNEVELYLNSYATNQNARYMSKTV